MSREALHTIPVLTTGIRMLPTESYLTSMNFGNARQADALSSSSAYLIGLLQIDVNKGPNNASRFCPEEI